MKLSKIHITLRILVLLVCCIGFTVVPTGIQEVSAVLKTKQILFKAGSTSVLDFKVSKAVPVQLFLHSSYGSVLLHSKTGHFALPEFITQEKGTIDYRLFCKKEALLKGSIEITANSETPILMESYIGPPSCNAGGNECTIQVVVATDSYDNPLPDSTAVYMKQQFLELEKEKISYTKDLIAWTPIRSYETAGRLFISSKVGKTTTKAFTVEVQPAIANDFEIKSVRKHRYADGNQIAAFHTSTIKDMYDNIISDGTLVHFRIQTANGAILHTQGSTIDGIAKAKILHPDHQDTWEIKAFIFGIAASNLLKIKYESVLDDFTVHFNAKNRELHVGPLLSFMEQLIPDGAVVVLTMYQKGVLITRKIQTSFHGKARFSLNKEIYPPGNYEIQLEALGVQKEPLKVVLK